MPAKSRTRRAPEPEPVEDEKDYTTYLDKAPTDLQERFAQWILDQTGYEPNDSDDFATGVQLATALRMEFQRSPENQAELERKRAAKEQEDEEKASAPPKRRGRPRKAQAEPEPEETEEEPEEAPKPRRGRTTRAKPAPKTPAKPAAKPRRTRRPAAKPADEDEGAPF
jgi:hypothetical protein